MTLTPRKPRSELQSPPSDRRIPRQLAPGSSPSQHINELLFFARSSQRRHHDNIDGWRLFTDYLKLQGLYKKGARLDPVMTHVFGRLYASRFATAIRKRRTSIAELEQWVRTLHSYAEVEYVEKNRVELAEEREAEAAANKKEYMRQQRFDVPRFQLRQLIKQLYVRRGKVSPFNFAARFARANKYTMRYERHGSREKFIADAYSFPATELLDTDVPIDRWILARQLEELLKDHPEDESSIRSSDDV